MALWGNPLGLYSLAVLVPFIILYLIRPRPKELTLPSIMFFLKHEGAKQTRSFLQTFVRDWLFLIQLLVLIALCLGLAEPLIDVLTSYQAEQTVIILDVSASMSAGNRFSEAVDIAKKNIGKTTTIILAKDIPVTILEEADAASTLSALSQVKVSGTNSNIGDAMKAAIDKTQGGRVVVISDFLYNKGVDPEVARSMLEARGLTVDFYPVTGGKVNFGITDIDLTQSSAQVFIKNYNDEKQTVNVEVGSLKKELQIEANSVEMIFIQPPEGITKAEITTKDDMPADNIAYINIPPIKPTKVLLITSTEKTFIKAALDAIPNLNIEIATPPIIPSVDYDIIIISQAEVHRILPGTFDDIKLKVQAGASIIFTGQEVLPSTDLLPFTPTTLSKQGAQAAIDILNQLTRGVEFGRVPNYHKGTSLNGSLVLVTTEYNDPLIVINEVGRGFSIYYGIFDDQSDFKYSPSYPIFWNNIIRFLTGAQDLTKYNKQTGDLLHLGSEQLVTTPSATLQTKALLIDEIGIYKLPAYTLVGNLLSASEGDIAAEKGASKIAKIAESAGSQLRQESLTEYLVWIALALVLFEILYIKMRGDL